MRGLSEINAHFTEESGRFRQGSLKRIAEVAKVDYHIVANVLHQRKIATKDVDLKLRVYHAADRVVTEELEKEELLNQIENDES